jgi:hypothetical protein
MTRSVLALVAAVGCWGVEPTHEDPLLGIRRIYVERLAGQNSAAVRDMIVNAIQNSRMFRLTEDAEKSDAILRGSADDQVFNEMHQSSEDLHAGASVGSGSIGSSKSPVPRVSATVGEREASSSTERRHEATAAVRLVGKDGDVIWSTTQESGGAKFRGAAADVAEKVVRQLLLDLERARRVNAPRSSGSGK